MTSKSVKCLWCSQQVTALLHRQISQSGAVSFLWICEACKRGNPEKKNYFISKEVIGKHLAPEQIEALPLIMPDLTNRCAVCGSRDVELHHWMPQALHKDANDWPKDFLCKPCHDEWHSVVTPGLKRGEI